MKSYVKLGTGLLLGTAMLSGVSALRADDKAETKPAESKPAESSKIDLKLFAKDAQWKFAKNTGDGSFELSTDGETPIGVLKFDFTNSKAQSTPYVLAITTVNIAESKGDFTFSARSEVVKRITMRLVDDGGQTLQTKAQIPASGKWEPVKIPLTKKFEHWDGANDGKIHFPIKSFVISIPLPNEDAKTGKIEFSNATVVNK